MTARELVAKDIPSIIDDVVALVRDRGALSKEEALAAWPMSDEVYGLLREKVLARPGISSGPRGPGGFVATAGRGKAPAEEASDEVVLRAGWERTAVDRPVGLLQHGQMETLLGTLLHTIRQVRRHRTGEDRRGTKRELATALVVQHGLDLLRESDVRRAVSSACRVPAPGRWHPGKAAAAAFVRDAGFPVELAGVSTSERRPSFELLEGRVELPPLWRFQQEVQRKLLEKLMAPGDRGLVTLPTGAGKTRVAVESVRYWLADRYDAVNNVTQRGIAIWLAHTEELCEQAYACFRQVWQAEPQRSPLLLVRFWGGYTTSREAVDEAIQQSRLVPSVIISTPQRLINLIRGNIERGREIARDLGAATGLILVDEAHRAAARSYREILNHFTELGHRVSVVGLTATPFRMEYLLDDAAQGTRELRDLFHHLLEPDKSLGNEPRARLQDMGVLARPEFETLDTATTLRLPGYDPETLDDEGTVEQLDRVLALRTDRSPRRLVVHERVVAAAAEDGSSILYFGPSVRDAECMAYMLRASGIPSAVITGTTRDAVRREVVSDFKAGRVKVLCNCEVLTTGFDAPRVTHVVMARPTVSQVLYEQMVGRGLRGPKFGGTEHCRIVDCKDDIRGPRPELGYEAFRRVWGGPGAQAEG